MHRSDLLGPLDWSTWSPNFVRRLLPLRVAWQPLARRLLGADLGVNGSWALRDIDDGATWLIKASGADVHVERGAVRADVGIAGPPGSLLAFLLGRPTDDALPVTGNATG